MESYNCECECDKSWDVRKYLGYKNCKCRKSLIDKLIEECSKNIYEKETLDIIPLDSVPLNVYKNVYSSCIVYIGLFVVFLITSICCAFYLFLLVFKKI